MLAAVIFDFDGVLADSEPLHFEAFRRVLRREGIELGEREYYERYLGFDDAGALRAVLGDRGRPADDALVDELVRTKLDVFPQVLDNRQVLFAGAAECVLRLGARVPLAIASGALSHDIDLILGGSGLRERFRAIVAADHTARSKPDPEPYLRAVERLEAAGAIPSQTPPRRIVAIEDSRWGLQSARGAGLTTIAVTTSYPAGELAGDADLVVDGLDAITLDRLDTLVGRT